MNAQTLERLLTDQAFGELPEDTAELLAAYLAEHPADRRAGEQIAAMVRSARRALNAAPPPRPQSFPADAIRQRWRTRQRWALVGRITSLAACVLIGIGVHAAWTARMTTIGPGGSVDRIVTGPVPTPPGDTVRLAVRDAGFWSWKEVYQRAGRPRPEPARRVIWDSPLSTPKVGGST
ncbi:MAG: hypothetical protein AMXMBFR83_23700 [Phycisphaerae bacterium]